MVILETPRRIKYIMSLLPHLETVISGNNLDAAQAEAAMLEILSGEATTAQIAALLGSADER